MAKNCLIGFSVIAILCTSAFAYACSCMWSGSFLTMARKAPLVIRGTVRSYQGQIDRPNSPTPLYREMEVAVIEVLKGELDLKSIRVEGDDGVKCLKYVTAFPIGTEWLFVFPDKNVFQAGTCGEYAIKVDGDYVTGSIEKGENRAERMTLSVVRARILADR